MQRRRNKTFAELLKKSLTSEIGFDGYDSVEKTIDGRKVSHDKYKKVASDFGLITDGNGVSLVKMADGSALGIDQNGDYRRITGGDAQSNFQLGNVVIQKVQNGYINPVDQSIITKDTEGNLTDANGTTFLSLSDSEERLGENAEHKALRQYRDSWARILLSIPFGNFLAKRRDTNNLALALLWNVLWKPEADAPTWKQVVQYSGMVLGLLTFITPAWFLFRVATNLVFNGIVKPVALVLPRLAYKGFNELYRRANSLDDNSAGKSVAKFFAGFAAGLFYGIHYVTSTIFDPINAARSSYKNGGVFGAPLAVLRLAVGAVSFAFIVSIAQGAITQITPFFTTTVGPWLVGNLPKLVSIAKAVGNLLAPAYSAVSGWVAGGLSYIYANVIATSPVLSILTMMFNAAVLSLANTVGVAVVQPMMIGLGAAAAVVVGTVGSGVERLASFIRNKWVAAPEAAAIPAGQPGPIAGSKAAIRANLAALTIAHHRSVAQVQQQLSEAASEQSVQQRLAEKADKKDVKKIKEGCEKLHDSIVGEFENVDKELDALKTTGSAAALAQFGLNAAPVVMPPSETEELVPSPSVALRSSTD